MARDMTIVLPDRPGALVTAWKKLSEAGVNIEGACGFPHRGQTWVTLHILVADGDAARRAIEQAGFQVVNERSVDVTDIEDRPGALAEIFQKYVDSERNVDLVYLASNHRVVIGTDDTHEDKPGYSTLGKKV